MALEQSPPAVASQPRRLFAISLATATVRLAQVVLLLLAMGALAMLRSDSSYAMLAVAAMVTIVALAANIGTRREMLLWCGYASLLLLFAQLRAAADETGIPARYTYVIEADRLLMFGSHPTVWLQSNLAAATPFVDVVAIATHLSYFLVPQLLGAVLLIRHHPITVVYLGAILATVYAGLVVCFLVPTAPPWLASREGALPPVERVLEERVFSLDERAMNRGESIAGVNDVAAMPSLHAALPAVIIGLAWSAGRRWRILSIGYCGLMGASLVYLGEHYVVDVVAGVALGLAAWAVLSAIHSSPRARSWARIGRRVQHHRAQS